MHFFAISSLLVGISNSLVAIWVYLNGRGKKINILWAFFVIAAAIWGFGGYKFTATLQRVEVDLWLRIAYIGVIFIPTLFYQFVLSFLGIKRKKSVIALYLLSIFFVIICFSSKNLFFGEPGIIFSSFYWITAPGPVWYLFVFYFFAMVVYSEFMLFTAYNNAAGLKRNQIRYILFSTLFGYTAGGACFLPCFGINLYPGIGNIGVALYCIPISYAIVKYRLMDIRVAITRTGIFMFVYTLVLGLPFAVAVSFKQRFIGLLGDSWWLVPCALLLILATAGPFLYIYLQRRAEMLFLRRQRTYQDTLKLAARELSSIHHLKRLLNLIVHMVTKTANISYSAVYLWNEEEKCYRLRARHNFKFNVPVDLKKDNPIVRWLQANREPLVYEEVLQKTQETPKPALAELEREMKEVRAAVIVPGFLNEKLLGILTMGNKRKGELYTTQDLDTFSVIANQAALAIENAMLYEDMEGQIKARTKELVEVQKQLVQAEKMATVGTLAGGVAHEINNPLTAILTNVQMLLMSGELDRESLELIEEATKRCRTIVQKLMAYAKKPLETGETKQVDLREAINNVIALLDYQFAQDNIKIIFAVNKGEFTVIGNQNELEQVITNIVINARDAIKQAKKSGQIHILLEKANDRIKIIIKDDGVGIPKEIIPRIFDPFFTTKEIGKGLGLGLSICQSIIDQHRGRITVESTPSAGAEFTVELLKAKK